MAWQFLDTWEASVETTRLDGGGTLMKKSYQEQSPFKELVTTAKQHLKVVIDVNTQNYSLRQIGRKNDSNESFTAIKGLFPLFSINLF